MHEVIIDIETNAIEDWRELSDLHVIHCIVIRSKDDVETYNSRMGNIEEGLRVLQNADVIIGHNIQKFDIPALQILYPDFTPKGVIRDTLLLARLVWPDTKNDDFKRSDFPKNLIGSHSLKAWGHRLGQYKGDYSENTDWSAWSQELEDYCVQDTLVTQFLWSAIQAQNPDPRAVILEHDFADVINEQERTGFRFDTEGAGKLHADLMGRKAELEGSLQEIFPAAEVPMKTPQYWTAGDDIFPTKGAAKKAGYKDGDILRGPLRVKNIPFNPSSRDQIAQQLIRKYGWTPRRFTGAGKPQIDESILTAMEYDEASVLVEYLTITKRLGQLAEGREAWLRAVDKGRIHGRVNTNGTVSGRCTHSSPNLGQVPSVDAPWGKECRALFLPDEGHVLLGVDASSLELRMLAHFLAFADSGKYAEIVMDGDPHTANQEAAGLPTRASAKTFIYALIYGSGDQNLGRLVNGGAKEGRELRKKFMDGMPAFKKLKAAVDHSIKTRGYLVGLDGRHLPVRSSHSALNLLLQSAGAVVMKAATVKLNQEMHILNRGQPRKDWSRQLAHIHDEVQLSCPERTSNALGDTAVRAIINAGDLLGLQCALDAEFHVGANWSATH